MVKASTLSAMFRSSDMPFRRRHLTQWWVVQTVKNDPVRAVQVYKHLREHGGTSHAADLFLHMLEANQERPFALMVDLVFNRRPEPVRLPA